MACNRMTEDVAEGTDAFVQQRPPQWQGRCSVDPGRALAP
jgi:hypothetical protein